MTWLLLLVCAVPVDHGIIVLELGDYPGYGVIGGASVAYAMVGVPVPSWAPALTML
jgi:hypothetical protein